MRCTGVDQPISPHPSPASRMLAEDMCGWAPRWTDKIAWSELARKPRRGEAQGCVEQCHSRSYGLKEAQAQARVDQPGPG